MEIRQNSCSLDAQSHASPLHGGVPTETESIPCCKDEVPHNSDQSCQPPSLLQGFRLLLGGCLGSAEDSPTPPQCSHPLFRLFNNSLRHSCTGSIKVSFITRLPSHCLHLYSHLLFKSTHCGSPVTVIT